MASGDGYRTFWKRQAERRDVHPASEYRGRSCTRKPCAGSGARMFIAERGSGVQEQLFRRLLLLRTAIARCLGVAGRTRGRWVGWNQDRRSLRELTQLQGRLLFSRDTVFMVLSDGWETGD